MAALAIPSSLVDRQTATDRALERLQGVFAAYELFEARVPYVALYATGSLGRREVGSRSDLDVFLIDAAGHGERPLRNLDRIELLADLIRAARDAEFGEFSRDGEYLKVHRLAELLDFIGTRQDDSTNVFTARMLLLLESEALLGQPGYSRCVDAVLNVYSRDAEDDEAFRPIFLTNDIVRYWKTLCLNYEAKRHEIHDRRRAQKENGDEAEAAALRRLKVSLRVDLLKLRFNRLWTCFNGLAYLLAGVQDRQVTKEHVHDVVRLKPIERAEELARLVPETAADLQAAVDEYAVFLETTDHDKADVEGTFAGDDAYREMRDRAETFAGAMDSVVRVVGERSGLGRFLLL